MQDWEERLAALEKRLLAWRSRYSEELAKVVRERGLRRLFRRPRPEELQAAAEEARRRAGVAELSEFAALCDELCDLYEVSLPQDRATIRARIGSAENAFELFWNQIEASPERVRGPEAEKAFRRALVALAIDDLRADLGQVDLVLGRLLVAAAAGIDWRPHVAAVARVANKGMGGGGGGMGEYLLGFERSFYFRGEVAERLREAARGSLTAPR